MCLTPKAAAERRPKAVSQIAAEIARERLDAARARRASLSPAERLASLRALLREKLGDIEPAAAPAARALWTKQFSGFVVEAVAVDTAPGMSSPVMLIRPASASARIPIVLAFAQGGTEAFFSSRRADIADLLHRNVAVCLADVRGTGEIGRGRQDSEAATELMLGDTAMGGRLKDARTVLRYLSTRADVDPKRIAVWGDSFSDTNRRDLVLDQSPMQQPGPQAIRQADPLGSLLALFMALYEDDVRAVAARGGLVSYLSMLQDRFCYVPLDVVVPGILETADVGDVVSVLAPRAVLLEGLVDGRNRRLTAAEAGAELRAPELRPRLVLRELPAEPRLAAWLAAELLR